MAKYLFRADASIDIGSGHIMRCITLANELRRSGHDVFFICRDLPGHLGGVLEKNDIAYSLLAPINRAESDSEEPHFTHSEWLTVSQKIDFQQSEEIIADYQPDWIIVDHYALSAIWQGCAKQYGAKVCVLDDLADRPHLADILIDQNLGRDASDYHTLVPSYCQLLIGPQYALLRPEFKQWRDFSLKRRANINNIRHLLINLGGVDRDNITSKILTELAKGFVLDTETRVTVVMGRTAPHLQQVIKKAKDMPYPTQVLRDVNNMAELMAHADLAIGAAGSTSWERCCLGLPTVLIVLAENQKEIARHLSDSGTSISLDKNAFHLKEKILQLKTKQLSDMSNKSQAMVNGEGVVKIIGFLH